MFYSVGENRRKHWYRLLTIGQKKLLALVFVFALLAVSALGTLIFYSVRAMHYDIRAVVADAGSSMLYDADNRPIAALSGETQAPLLRQELPDCLVNAFVAREDEDFFSHNGVVFTSVIRSMLRNMTSMRYEQGASTITMQLTRNVYDLHDKTLDRKLLESILAQRIERTYDKDTILAQYLSRIYFGQNCNGLRAAAQHYFNKSVSELNLVESATLAGLVRGPSIYNPERSMEKAMRVKAETLDRMEDCGFITAEECAAAKAAPIELQHSAGSPYGVNTYAGMWAQTELDELSGFITAEQSVSGFSVVSNLNLPIQQLIEQATERALTAVENPAHYPETWSAAAEDEQAAEEQKKAWMKLRRPKGLKVRGEDNDFSGILQACVLVVDTRRSTRGQVLAVVGGRSAADGIDRWQGVLQPGRAAAPLLFCCACLPGHDDRHIVARDTEITGRSLGYEPVRAFYDSLHLEKAELPEKDRADDLYNGIFPLRRIDLANLHFRLQNQGRGYRLSLVNTIWNRHQIPVYRYEADKAPEYIRRETADAVAGLSPFIVQEGQPIILNETLAGHTGQWVMIYRPKAVCVFVWMGMDDADSAIAAAPEWRALLPKAAMNLAREVFDGSRAVLRARQAEETQPAQK